MNAIQLKLPDDGSLKVHLNRSAYFTLPAREPVALEVLSGCAWITQEGDRDDYFLSRGERFNLPGQGEAIVQAMHESEIAVFPRPAPSAASGFTSWLKSVAEGWLHHDVSATESSRETAHDATQCWRNVIERQSAMRLGLERTF
ncbi:MAG: DUF2917 domain-containing protein [Betaproteobacteria bacterium]|nr:DUF2917 domain-containing protein [Betaproteobacteria bacterium]